MTVPEPTRALIVDDDPVVARAIARRLLREGYTVSLGQTCRKARASGGGFQVAVLDLDLPDGNGADLAAELLRLGAVRSVVFYTGSLDTAQRERAERFGVIVDKSRELEDLVSTLEPFPTAPPISHMAPAPRGRSSGSGARLNRVIGDEERAVDAVATKTSSRR
jgi:DNA-binding NtrC family response regulator